MSNLKIRFISEKKMSTGLRQQFDALDLLAFSNDEHKDDPEFSAIKWNSTCDWFVLGWLESKIVTQLCLVKRKIIVGDRKVWVVGIGGVATHPDWQHQGLASNLLHVTEDFIQREICVPFGLLVCADKTRRFYIQAGWKQVAHELFFIQNGERRLMKTAVMTLSLVGDTWRAGAINLCGPPW